MITLKNPGLLELELMCTMGANVKQSDSAIGYFGTGLKYAIATLLREGIEFHVFIGCNRYDFYSEEKTLRGKKFELCYMKGPFDSTPLGFTTELGKNWKVWQAYREIYSNCLDEGGVINHGGRPNPDAESTTFFISTDIEVDGVFLCEMDKKLLYSDNDVDILGGESGHIYYQGIRAKDLNKNSIYTYNIKKKCELTEDRQLCYSFVVDAIIQNAVAKMEDKGIIKSVVAAPKDSYESSFTFGDWGSEKPGQNFMEVVGTEKNINPTIKRYVSSYTPKRPLTDLERKQNFINEIIGICDENNVSCSDRGDHIILADGVLSI